MKESISALYDLIFVVVATIFIICLYHILCTNPAEWLPWIGLIVTGRLLLPIYTHFFDAKERNKR